MIGKRWRWCDEGITVYVPCIRYIGGLGLSAIWNGVGRIGQ